VEVTTCLTESFFA